MNDTPLSTLIHENSDERVVFVEDEDEETWMYNLIRGWDDDVPKEVLDLFELVPGRHQAGTDYYQGLNFMGLIKRKSDGKIFGYPYWEDISKYGEPYIEANGYEQGLGYEVEYWVWRPAETYVIEGWKLIDE